MPEENANVGRIVEIRGVVIDVAFAGELPEIYNASASGSRSGTAGPEST